MESQRDEEKFRFIQVSISTGTSSIEIVLHSFCQGHGFFLFNAGCSILTNFTAFIICIFRVYKGIPLYI